MESDFRNQIFHHSFNVCQGMDKILWGMGRNEGQVEVTNDGATILRAIGVDNPAAKILVDMSKVQVKKVTSNFKQRSCQVV